MKRAGWFGVVAASIVLAAAGPTGAVGKSAKSVKGLNPYNDEILALSPPDRAAKLAAEIGIWCIGTKAFLMGVTKSGPALGYAYWSLQCAGDGSYAIQIDPQGKGLATACSVLKQNGEGRECFKKF
jgi:hypothetical protein